jgi:hypothetical protein
MAFFNRLAGMLRGPQGGLALNPVTQSVLAQQLLANSMQSPQGLVSGAGVANKVLQGLLAGQQARASQQQADLTSGRQSALAGALSRTGQGGPQGEAARRAALIISGGLPDDPLAQKLLGNQADTAFPKKGSDLIGVANPSDFEPSSLKAYLESGDPGVLVPRNNMFGRYTPSNYTPESWAQFIQSGDPSALKLRGDYRFQQTPSGAVVAGNTITGQVSPTTVTPEIATAEAANRKRAESEAAASGEAAGKAQGAILSRALNAEGIEDILNIAEPLIDEATGSGTGAGRDKLAAFFGVSTTGAQAIAQLLPLQAAIMLRQPRMEGPQSDRDVQLYREAAGQLGDPAVPRETKKAAIQTIRRLQQQYKNNATGGGATSTNQVDFSSMSDEELQRLINGQ